MLNILTATIFVTQVRKPPDIGKIDGKSDDRQKEINFAGPGLPAVGSVVQL